MEQLGAVASGACGCHKQHVWGQVEGVACVLGWGVLLGLVPRMHHGGPAESLPSGDMHRWRHWSCALV